MAVLDVGARDDGRGRQRVAQRLRDTRRGDDDRVERRRLFVDDLTRGDGRDGEKAGAAQPDGVRKLLVNRHANAPCSPHPREVFGNGNVAPQGGA